MAYQDLKFDFIAVDDSGNIDEAVQVKIKKRSNNEVIPEDEPIFILRGRDLLALPTLIYYLALCGDAQCTEYQLNGMDAVLRNFREFKSKHSERMKQPGMTEGK